MSKKLKKPGDYPQFYCRMNSVEKNMIDKLIEDIILKSIKIDKLVDEDDNLKLKRNFIIQKSLLAGLKAFDQKLENKINQLKSKKRKRIRKRS